MALKWLVIFPLFISTSSLLQAQSGGDFLITTVAGNGTPGYSGDGGPATNAKLLSPGPVAVDGSGNIYFADLNNNVVREVATNGIITTVAGNGVAGYSGDGGAATSASVSLAGLSNMAVDASGNLYIAENLNNRVRKITPGGIISTVAGNGNHGFSGDGGPATSASLYTPNAVALDGLGNLFIADSGNLRVRKVTPGGIISTVAGNGTQGSTGDGGPATSAELGPTSVAVDASGNLYILSLGVWTGVGTIPASIRKITPAGTITTVVGTSVGSPQGPVGYAGPTYVAADAAGNLYLADSFANLILSVTPAGVVTALAGNGTQGYSGDGGPATSASLHGPNGVTVSATGNIFFADNSNERIRELVAVQPTTGCLYSIDQKSQTFASSGGNGTVAVLTSAAGCSWLASSEAAWITITSATSGTGSSVVSYSVAPNTSSAARTGLIAIAGYVFTVSQTGVQCSVNINPNSVAVPKEGEIGGLIDVTANAPDCIWTAQDNVSWILIGSGTVGTGNGGVTYTVGPNVGGSRTATIIIAVSATQKVFTVNQAGTPAITNVQNGAGFAKGTISPEAWVAIFGTGLAPAGDSRTWNPTTEIVNGMFPLSLDGTSVTVNGKPAAVEFIQPTQVNIQAPDDTALGPVQVVATTPAGVSNSFTINYAKFAPGLFTAAAPYIVAQHADYSYVTTTAPATPGEVIILWGTGFGPANPAVPSGQVLSGASPLANAVTVTIGGQPAVIDFAGVIAAGLVQINVHVPSGIKNGDAGVIATVGGVSTQTTANMISVHN